MFGTLFIKECKQILRSLVYYIYVIVLILFLTSQMSGDSVNDLQKPKKGLDYYGMTVSTDKTDIMERTLADLLQEVYQNSFSTYPMGFYKQVILNDAELDEIKEIIEDCSGKDWDTLEKEMLEYYEAADQSTIEGAMQAMAEDRIEVKKDISYGTFCKKMERVCKIIGKGSSYEKKRLDYGVDVPSDYETALKEYNGIIEKDKVTGAYMRLFCDYAGIVLAVLPIFLGVTRCLRDKRSQVAQVIYARNAGAGMIQGSRYLANVCMAFLPVLIVSFVLQLPWQYQAQTLGTKADVLAFLKYDVIWLLPEIMIVLAVAFFITELTENVISIFVQVVWAVVSLFSATGLVGGFGFKLVTRWNEVGGSVLYEQQKSQLYCNRGFYFVLSLVLFALTCLVYEKKRKEGETIYGKIFKRRK